MSIRMTEQELRELVKDPGLPQDVAKAAWERLRALARRPVASMAVCDEDSVLGQWMIKIRP